MNQIPLMNRSLTIPITFVALNLATSASAAVSLVGIDSASAANWRTAANLEADNEYGTAGYVVFGLNEADGVYNPNFDVSDTNPANAYNPPLWNLSLNCGHQHRNVVRQWELWHN